MRAEHPHEGGGQAKGEEEHHHHDHRVFLSESAGQEEPGDDLAGVVPDDDVAQGIEHHDLPHIGGP